MSWSNFDNSVQNEGGFMENSMDTSSQADDKGNLKRGNNCIPVMIGHMNKHGDKLQVWGVPPKMITFVAIVLKCEQASTKINYEFKDDTGIIKGLKWLEEKTNFESKIKINEYARVYGLVRNEKNDTPYVMIINIQPLEELNELLTHQLEVTLVALQGEKQLNNPAGANRGLANGMAGNNQSMNGTMNASGLTSQQQTVLEIIQNSDPEYGAERDTIKARVPAHLSSKVDDIIEFLQAEGHIYTTKTDDHFKAI